MASTPSEWIHVKFPKWAGKMKIRDLREVKKTLAVGDSVTWTQAHYHIPHGSIGVITSIKNSNGDSSVRFQKVDDTDVQSRSSHYSLPLDQLVPSISTKALDMRAFYLAKTHTTWDVLSSPALFYGASYPDWVNKEKYESKKDDQSILKMHDDLMDKIRYSTLSSMLSSARQNGKQAGELAQETGSLGRVAHGKVVAYTLGHCLDKFVFETPSFTVELTTLKDHAMQQRHTFDNVDKKEREQLQTTRMEVSFYFSF